MRKRILGDENGATAVEFAIVSSILIVLCLGIMQFGISLHSRNEMGRAADMAVRIVMLNPKLSDPEFKAEVYKALPNYNKEKLIVEAGRTKIGSTDFRTLKLRYELVSFVPGLPSGTVALTVGRQAPAF